MKRDLNWKLPANGTEQTVATINAGPAVTGMHATISGYIPSHSPSHWEVCGRGLRSYDSHESPSDEVSSIVSRKVSLATDEKVNEVFRTNRS